MATIVLCLVTQSCLILVTPWTVACQVPLSMRFSKQEYWHGLPFPSPEDLPNPGIEPGSPALQADSSPTELQGNMLSRFLIASVLRRKHLLMSWLQLPSAVILEPKKIKSLTVSILSPSICHKAMGTNAMILIF